MSKQKKILIATLPVLGLLLVLFIVLFATRLIDGLAFGLIFSLLIVLIAINIFLLVKVIKKIKSIRKENKNVISSDNYMTDIYAILGIPVQYNKDGSVKDIYDLLGIEPQFDEKGNRVLTIYELLGIIPRFDQNGNEIPTVVAIKNRIGRIARVDVSSRVLTRKLTDQEKEELIIRETLKKKLDEATQSGDKAKAETIKKAIDQNKPKKDGSKPSKNKDKPLKFGIKSSGKALSDPKLKKINVTGDYKNFSKFFEGRKPSQKPKTEEKPKVKEEPAKPKEPAPEAKEMDGKPLATEINIHAMGEAESSPTESEPTL